MCSGLASRTRCLGGEATYSGVASGVVSVSTMSYVIGHTGRWTADAFHRRSVQDRCGGCIVSMAPLLLCNRDEQ